MDARGIQVYTMKQFERATCISRNGVEKMDVQCRSNYGPMAVCPTGMLDQIVGPATLNLNVIRSVGPWKCMYLTRRLGKRPVHPCIHHKPI